VWNEEGREREKEREREGERGKGYMVYEMMR
jgi:hypothetical protein